MATPCQIKKLINKGDLDAKIASVYGCKQEDAQPYAQRFAAASEQNLWSLGILSAALAFFNRLIFR
jgi:hypothetical protein